ncbi:MAG: hypothetical protein NC489_44785 [Ruminococcus flavefaciens]|nr:hypothetical protein [Ruminococcus flavefaciens]
MKTCVFQFPSGFWGVRCCVAPGEWFLYSVSDASKEAAIVHAREAASRLPSGRLYGKNKKKVRNKTK